MEALKRSKMVPETIVSERSCNAVCGSTVSLI